MKIYTNKILILFVLMLFASNIFSQVFITEDEASGKKPKTSFWDNVYFGGDLGLAFGSVTSINIAPEMGYIFNEKLSAGGGIIYQYYSLTSTVNPFSTSVYGGKIFGRYFIWEDLFAIGITEIVSLESRYYDYSGEFQNQNRFWIASPLVGAGYMQRFSSKGGISIMVLFNLNSSRNSPYYYYDGMPIIRIGIGF